MTAAEVAAMLRKSLPSFYNMRHQGLGPTAVRVDGRLRFRRSDVEAWLDAHTESADA